MKQSEEAEGMRQLLIDAVSTLCRSGIRYRAAMRVEGLIGITVDEEDIILVNVNKTFEATDKDHSAADVVSPETVVSPESPGTPKSRTRKRPHQETQSPSQPEAKEYNDDEQTTNFVLKQEPDDETQPVEEKRLRHPSGDAPTDSVQATDSLDVASTIHVEAVKQCPVDNNETVVKGTTDSLQDSNLSFASSEASPSMYTQELSETGPRLSQDFEGNVRGVKIELGSESEGEGTQPLGPGQSDVMLAGNSGTFSFPSNMQLSPVPVNMFGPGENLTGETEAQLNFPGVMPSPSGASTSRKSVPDVERHTMHQSVIKNGTQDKFVVEYLQHLGAGLNVCCLCTLENFHRVNKKKMEKHLRNVHINHGVNCRDVPWNSGPTIIAQHVAKSLLESTTLSAMPSHVENPLNSYAKSSDGQRGSCIHRRSPENTAEYMAAGVTFPTVSPSCCSASRERKSSSAADRQRLYRWRIRNDPERLAAYQARDTQRKKMAIQNMTDEQREQAKVLNRMRMRRWRANKAAASKVPVRVKREEGAT